MRNVWEMPPYVLPVVPDAFNSPPKRKHLRILWSGGPAAEGFMYQRSSPLFDGYHPHAYPALPEGRPSRLGEHRTEQGMRLRQLLLKPCVHACPNLSHIGRQAVQADDLVAFDHCDVLLRLHRGRVLPAGSSRRFSARSRSRSFEAFNACSSVLILRSKDQRSAGTLGQVPPIGACEIRGRYLAAALPACPARGPPFAAHASARHRLAQVLSGSLDSP